MGTTTPDDDIRIVEFSKDWIEQYLDLIEQDDSVDPLYGELISRDVERDRILWRWKSFTNLALSELLAVQKGQAISFGRAIVIPKCGDQAQKIATLSMTIAPSHRMSTIGTRLLDRLCKEMESKGVEWIEMAIMDSWTYWQRFLEKHGFTACERFADVFLGADIPIREGLPKTNATIRPIRLPEDRERVIELYNRERAQDYPKACAIQPDQSAWWEMEPWPKYFDAETFLIAEDKNTGELVGYVDSNLIPDEDFCGIIGYLDTSKKFKETNLEKRLLVQVIMTLRKKGAKDIKARVYHYGPRNEVELFQDLGFMTENSFTVWRKSILK